MKWGKWKINVETQLSALTTSKQHLNFNRDIYLYFYCSGFEKIYYIVLKIYGNLKLSKKIRNIHQEPKWSVARQKITFYSCTLYKIKNLSHFPSQQTNKFWRVFEEKINERVNSFANQRRSLSNYKRTVTLKSEWEHKMKLKRVLNSRKEDGKKKQRIRSVNLPVPFFHIRFNVSNPRTSEITSV